MPCGRLSPSTLWKAQAKALVESLVEEIGAINAAFDMAEKKMVVDRKGSAPIQIASFEC